MGFIQGTFGAGGGASYPQGSMFSEFKNALSEYFDNPNKNYNSLMETLMKLIYYNRGISPQIRTALENIGDMITQFQTNLQQGKNFLSMIERIENQLKDPNISPQAHAQLTQELKIIQGEYQSYLEKQKEEEEAIIKQSALLP